MAWPNGPETTDVKSEPVKTTIWKVSPYYKKSCEEHEHYIKDRMTIIRKTGFRGASFIVETNDGNPPEFEFDFVPGGDGKKDSLNMYDFPGSNIENVELESMWDGCWQDLDFDNMDIDEAERLQKLIDEEGDVYEVLENQEGWSQNETEAWIWGPILIEDEQGNQVKIVVADEDGNAVEYKDE